MERIFPSKVCVSSLGAFDHSHIEHVQYVVLPHVHVAFRFFRLSGKLDAQYLGFQLNYILMSWILVQKVILLMLKT